MSVSIRTQLFVAASALALLGAHDVAAQTAGGSTSAVNVEEITVTARRRVELLQDVPIPVTVLSASQVADTGTFNVTRLKEMVPTVQFYSTNPRNSAINIRGLGSPYGLTNDGIEPGVGLYIDGVFHARPAAATLDFVDVEQIEVLRGPQGTLYGKNTTAGAINVTSRRPQFTPRTDVEVSVGDLNFQQVKASITGPLSERIAARLSFSGTRRDGVLYNTATQDDLNDLNNLGLKGQVLFLVNDKLEVILAGDYTRQRPEGYAQVVAGVAPTQRAANRRYEGIAADLNYRPPSFDAFDRLTDADTPHRSYQDVGGAALTVNWEVGPGALTSITAWRYWDWNPSNDRDFLGLPITTISANPSEQRQFSQELRYAGDLSDRLNFVLGAFVFRQTIDSTGKQEQGSAAARFLLAPSAAAATPGLLNGYGQTSDISSTFLSAALFGQVEWSVTDRLRVMPGLRLNYDEKEVDYASFVYGGLQTTDAALIALQRSILAPQSYAAKTDDTNISGQITVAYEVSDAVNAYATYATSFKSVGLNLGGVPNNAAGAPALDAATVRPEEVTHYEAGIKTQPTRRITANFTVYQTEIKDFQAQVVNASVGVLRGYLANADKVRVRGAEFDGQARIGDGLTLYAAAAYTDAIYAAFTDAPPPLELTGGPQVVDISGSRLPGVSKWAGSVGGEYSAPVALAGRELEAFAGVDVSYRSDFSSSPSPSQYLNIEGYSLTNARLGVRSGDGWSAYLWARNLFDENYFELLSAAPGGSGLYVGLPGDPRTFGLTLRASF